jgi:hypothetical protein
MQTLLYIAAIIAIVALGYAFKMYPQLPPVREHFSSPAIAPEMPTCVKRSDAAQALLALLPADRCNNPSEDETDRKELRLILNKLTCLDSDVVNSGVAGYNTMYLQYNTSHDTEPLTNFVGRCLNGGARTRDIDIIMEKYESRGVELIGRITKKEGTDPAVAFKYFNAVISTTGHSLTHNCRMSRAQLDRPAGVRDPGYMMPFSVDKLAPFPRTMD